MVRQYYLIFSSQNYLVLVNFEKSLDTGSISQSDKWPLGSLFVETKAEISQKIHNKAPIPMLSLDGLFRALI